MWSLHIVFRKRGFLRSLRGPRTSMTLTSYQRRPWSFPSVIGAKPWEWCSCVRGYTGSEVLESIHIPFLRSCLNTLGTVHEKKSRFLLDTIWAHDSPFSVAFLIVYKFPNSIRFFFNKLSLQWRRVSGLNCSRMLFLILRRKWIFVHNIVSKMSLDLRM